MKNTTKPIMRVRLENHMKIGDTVRHLEQDIVGIVVRIHKSTNEIVIEDSYSEYLSPDNQLVYRLNELEVVENYNYNDYGLDEWDIR